MHDFTVEDILKGKGESLRQRAKGRYEEHKRAQELALEEAREELQSDLVQYLQDVMQMSDGEIADTTFNQSKYGSAAIPAIEFSVEGMNFRARMVNKVLTVEYKQVATYQTIRSLEDLGKYV